MSFLGLPDMRWRPNSASQTGYSKVAKFYLFFLEQYCIQKLFATCSRNSANLCFFIRTAKGQPMGSYLQVCRPTCLTKKVSTSFENGSSSSSVSPYQGMPDRLLDHLMEDHSTIDPTYVEDYLLTYVIFNFKPHELASKLVKWFDREQLKDKV